MKAMTEVPPWFRGPLPLAAAPKTASSAADSPSAADEAPTLPTRWHKLANGRTAVENPNQCEICHGLRHQDLAHHAFEPAVETEAQARLLGWPLPEEAPSW